MTQLKNKTIHKPLDITPLNNIAFSAKAFAEAEGCLSVGGLLHGEEETKPSPDTARLPLARLIELARRKKRLSVEDLAREADVELSELVAIENGDDIEPDPKTLHRLAIFFNIRVESLIELAGAMTNRQSRINEAALRFAARSEPMTMLTAEEEKALNEFVAELAK
ncbi:MAG: helix-turn-helix transcriptional regulator [Phycisphaerales bacterium]|jgi:transcriptional regulator with XRE-family HTH domain|nr:helix-turn-helix transcriptional regulator [Phycisphaerales bacterium]